MAPSFAPRCLSRLSRLSLEIALEGRHPLVTYHLDGQIHRRMWHTEVVSRSTDPYKNLGRIDSCDIMTSRGNNLDIGRLRPGFQKCFDIQDAEFERVL
jgi:hypothetical protein